MTVPAESVSRHVLRPEMDVCWQFDYALDQQQLEALYAKSKRMQWDAAVDIDWERAIDPSRPLVDESLFRFEALPSVQSASRSQQERLRAELACNHLSQFLHGEQGALMTAGALTHAVPDHQAKLYAATQTMDEARHVAFGNVYVTEAIAAMHEDERESVADFAFEAVCIMRDSRARHSGFEPGFLAALESAGFDPQDLLKDIVALRATGQKVEVPKDQVHAFKDLMMPALVRVGAVTARTREQYAKARIPVWENRAALEKIEAEGSFA